MQLTLSGEQEAYQKTFRDWLSDVAPTTLVRTWLDADDEATFEERMIKDGWLGVGISEDLAGQGGGLVELVLTAEELARAGAPTSAWLATALAVPALACRPDTAQDALHGNPVSVLQPAEALPDGKTHVSIDAQGRVSGLVPRVLAGSRAASFVAVVENEGARSLRRVDAAADGVEVSRRRLLDRSRSVADVRLESVASEPLTVDAGEFMREYAGRAAVLVAADALGATERMLELAVDYSKQRHQFGVPIGSFQAVKHAAATMLVGVEAGRSVLYYAAASLEAGEAECDLHAAATKAQVTAECAQAADTALTLHGAIGYTWEHDLHLFYKRAKLDVHLFGSPEAWNDRIADGLHLI